jgi:hypothetical protein
MKKPKYYSIRKRMDCNRYELVINDTKGFGQRYGGLFPTRKEAEESAEKDWGLTVFREREDQRQ